MNEKKIAPNECSLGRWIATVVVGYLLGSVLGTPLMVAVSLNTELLNSTFLEIPVERLYHIVIFAFMFWGQVIALKWIAKTSLKDFVLGVGGTVNKKVCWTIVGLHAAGVVIASLLTVYNISLRGIGADTFIVLLILMLPLSLMQTAWEEMIFRGVFQRWACKNKIGYTKKALIGAVLSSILFGLMHLENPEISSMSGFELVVGVICYILPGLVCYFANLQFGNLLPGMLIHWVNNFLVFTVISGEVSALAMPTLFIDSTQMSGLFLLVGAVVVNVPVTGYILWSYLKDKKAAAVQKA